MVHRDVKPDNVVLVQRATGELVKVLDFGISMVTGDLARGERITSAGTIVGTPEYMSPEQTVGESVDHRADIYAWGVLAYETLTGTLPFEADTSMKMLLAHRLQAPEPLSSRWPDAGFPVALETLVMRALAKSPDDRPQSMNEVARELAQLASALGIATFTPTQPFGSPPPTTGTPPPSNPAFAPTLPSLPTPAGVARPTALVLPPGDAIAPPPARRPRSRLFLGVAAAALAIGIGGGILVVRSNAAPPAPVVEAVPLPTPAPAALPDLPPAPSVPAPAPAEARPPRPEEPKASRLIHLVTVPAGARVFVDGKPAGTTPMDFEVTDGRPRRVRFVLDGYRPARRLVAYKLKSSTLEIPLQKRARGEKPPPADELADDLKADPYPDAEKP
ncbi:MAG: serine/threonine-protein kinase [Myxococcales bacterium]